MRIDLAALPESAQPHEGTVNAAPGVESSFADLFGALALAAANSRSGMKGAEAEVDLAGLETGLAAQPGASALLQTVESPRSPDADRDGELFPPGNPGLLGGHADPRYAALPSATAGDRDPTAPVIERLQRGPSPAREPTLDPDAPAIPRTPAPALGPVLAGPAAAPHVEPETPQTEYPRRVPGPERDAAVRPTLVDPKLPLVDDTDRRASALTRAALNPAEPGAREVATAAARRSGAAPSEPPASSFPDPRTQTPQGEATRPAQASPQRGLEPQGADARSGESFVPARSGPHGSAAATPRPDARPGAVERVRFRTREEPPAILEAAPREAAARRQQPDRGFSRMAAPADPTAVEPRDGGTPRPAQSPASEGPLPVVGADARVPEPRVETPREALPSAQSLQALTQRVEWLATRGGGTARVHLDPPHLGEVELQIRAVGSAIRVSMIAEEAGARVLLEAGREWLVDQFASRDLRVSHFEVHDRSAAGGHGDTLASRNHAGGDAQNEGARGREDRPGPSNRPTSPDSAPLTTPAANPGVRRVDLRI